MSGRTKEALIAQHAKAQLQKGGKSKRRPRFSPFAGSLEVFTIFSVLLGVAFIALPFVLPSSLGNSVYKNRILQNVANLELTNDVYPGQFKLTSRPGDTRPNSDANFWAVNILKSAGLKLKNESGATSLVANRFKSDNFGNSLKDIYQNILYAKSLGQFAEGNAAAKRVYERILRFSEKNSGFRLTEQYTPSLDATFYAFEAISELGKFSDFEKRDEFKSSLSFVSSLISSDFGYKNKASENSTLTSTYHAVSVLSRSPSTSALTSSTAQYIYSCQANDGGFRETPFLTTSSLLSSPSSSQSSSVASTAKALITLNLLKEENKVNINEGNSFSSTSFNLFGPYYDAVSFIVHSLSSSYGVVSSPTSRTIDLEAAYYLSRLYKSSSSVAFPGITRSLTFTFFFLGLLFLFPLSLFALVRSKISRVYIQSFESFLLITLSTLTVAHFITLLSLPFASLLSFVLFSVFILFVSIQLYHILINDNTDGLVFILGLSHLFTLSGIFYFLSNFIYPGFGFGGVFVRFPKILIILPILQVMSAIGVGAIGSYVSRVKKMSFYRDAGIIGWIGNMIVMWGMLGSEGVESVVGRGGMEGWVWGVWPVMSLVLGVGGSVAGAWYEMEYEERSEDAAAVVEDKVEEGADKKEKKEKKKVLKNKEENTNNTQEETKTENKVDEVD